MKKHAVLKRQLKRCDLDESKCPKDLENWQRFLDRINRAYQDLDQERYLSERLQKVSSKETDELFANLKEKETYLQAIFDHAAEAIVTINTEGKIESFNPKAVDLFGHTYDQVYGKNVTMLMPPNLRKKHLRGFNHYLATNESKIIGHSPVEMIALHKDGHTFPIDLSITEAIVKNDRVFLGVIRDITEEKRVEEKEKELNKELVNTARYAGMADVATSVLHNIGNVLNSVSVSATLIKEKLTESKLLYAFTKISENILKHKNDLSDYLAKDQKGKYFIKYLILFDKALKDERNNINEELEELINNIQHIKEIVIAQQGLVEHGISVVEPVSLNLEIEKAIKMIGFNDEYDIKHDYHIKDQILLDRIKFTQILVNLLRNAKDAVMSFSRDEMKEIKISTKHKDNTAQIKVIDNGIGFDKKDANKIFTFGYTTKKEGHGYGLHTSALLAKEMNGSLKGESEGVNLGATFTLEFPYKILENGVKS